LPGVGVGSVYTSTSPIPRSCGIGYVVVVVVVDLFFKCEYSNVVWQEVQNLLDRRFSSNWKNIIEEISEMTANSNIWSILRRIVIGAVVYYVWQERNNRLFDKGSRTEDELVKNIVETVKMRMMSFHVKDSRTVLEVERKWKVILKRSVV
jgi:hypothetical protein